MEHSSSCAARVVLFACACRVWDKRRFCVLIVGVVVVQKSSVCDKESPHNKNTADARTPDTFHTSSINKQLQEGVASCRCVGDNSPTDTDTTADQDRSEKYVDVLPRDVISATALPADLRAKFHDHALLSSKQHHFLPLLHFLPSNLTLRRYTTSSAEPPILSHPFLGKPEVYFAVYQQNRAPDWSDTPPEWVTRAVW